MVMHKDESDATVRNDALKSHSGETGPAPDTEARCKTLTEERDDLERKLKTSDTEARCKNLTEERDDLERKLKTSVSQRDSLTEERDELKRINSDTEARCKTLTEERDDLERKLKTFGWVYFSDSVYYISSTKKTWQDSRNDCLQKGADLMIINSKEEQDFTRQLKDFMWIGLTDRETEGTWKWLLGE
ncbi:C-type lectin domain family 4 member F-like [Seriola dumerili]|uniref:C-type lectin domain family 4 member F-like n=1 Tax=Seriola dumerili TaxID=41447 RepID=UPI000BBE5B9C|nr:C-type lectin domain family 4 member F-like [Seriola dumerili]